MEVASHGSASNGGGLDQVADGVRMSHPGRSPDAGSEDVLDVEMANDLEEIRTVIEAFDAFAETRGVPLEVRRRVNVVLDELLNNVVSYGYDDEDEHVIAVRFECSTGRLLVRVVDDGRPFNPLEQGPPDPKESIEEAGLGGVGIHLLQNLMDEASYRRRSESNVLELVKHLPT